MNPLPLGLIAAGALVLAGCTATRTAEPPPASDIVNVKSPVGVKPDTQTAATKVPRSESPTPERPRSSQAPLVPLQERADGGLVVTHQVKIAGRMIRFSGKPPEAKGPLDFLADTAGLKAGTVLLTQAQADAALAALTRATLQDVEPMPRVQVGVGVPARIGIGQELRYPAGWKKDPAPAGGWMASRIETRTLGTSLLVCSQLATDGSLQLDVTVGTTELDGFIEFEGPTEKTTSVTEFFAVNEPPKSGAQPVAVNMGPHPAPFFEPVFSTQTVTASGRLAEGLTLVLRGDGERPAGKSETLLVFLTAKVSPVVR